MADLDYEGPIATKDAERGMVIFVPAEDGVKAELVPAWDNDFNDIQEGSR